MRRGFAGLATAPEFALRTTTAVVLITARRRPDHRPELERSTWTASTAAGLATAPAILERLTVTFKDS